MVGNQTRERYPTAFPQYLMTSTSPTTFVLTYRQPILTVILASIPSPLFPPLILAPNRSYFNPNPLPCIPMSDDIHATQLSFFLSPFPELCGLWPNEECLVQCTKEYTVIRLGGVRNLCSRLHVSHLTSLYTRKRRWKRNQHLYYFNGQSWKMYKTITYYS